MASGGSADAKAVLILDASYFMVEEDAEGPRIPLNFFMDAAEADAETLSQYVWHDTNTPYQGEYYIWAGMRWVHEGYDITGVEQPFEFEVVMDADA